MSNTATLKKVFNQVQTRVNTGQYRWVSEDTEIEDYFDWGLSHNTTADSLINLMIEQGDLETVE